MENDESQLFGIHAVMEAIKSGKTIDKIFLQKGLQGELSRELILLLREHKIVPNTVPIEKLNKLTRRNHQGVVAFVAPIDFHDLEEIIETSVELLEYREPCPELAELDPSVE